MEQKTIEELAYRHATKENGNMTSFLAGFKAAQGVMGDLIKYKVAQYELELSGNILSKIGIAYNDIRIKELNDLLEKLK